MLVFTFYLTIDMTMCPTWLIVILFSSGTIPRTRDKDGSTIKHNHASHGVPTNMHGCLAIELYFILI